MDRPASRDLDKRDDVPHHVADYAQEKLAGLETVAKATPMPPEHVAAEPRTVRDLATGEESYVDRWAIVTSKRRRCVFVAIHRLLGGQAEAQLAR